MRSRINTNLKKQNIKVMAAIGILLILLITFGTQLLVGLGAAVNFFKGSNEVDTTSQSVNYIAPPEINPLPDAVKNSTIDVSGYSPSAVQFVHLYVNGEKVAEAGLKNERNFNFTDVNLSPGENNIEAKSVTKDNKQSDFSDTVTVRYLDREPTLDIIEPNEGQTFKKDQSPITIRGRSDKGTRVTVNDFWAISDDEGNFSYSYSLKDGDNTIKIVSTDEAGNITTKELKIKVE